MNTIAFHKPLPFFAGNPDMVYLILLAEIQKDIVLYNILVPYRRRTGGFSKPGKQEVKNCLVLRYKDQ